MMLLILSVCLFATSGIQGSGGESISSQKCKEYGKLFQAPDFHFPTSCNNRTFVGAKQAKLGEFPYMASLIYNSSSGLSHRCTGALISKNYVISPAYCLYSRSLGSPIAVILGQLKVDDMNEGPPTLNPGAQKVKIVELSTHPEFNPKTKKNVLGLIKLEKDVIFDRNVHPICLNEKEVTEEKLMCSGWNSHTAYSEAYFGDLIKTMMTVFSQDECKKIYHNPDRPAVGISDKEICAGVKRYGCDKQPIGTLQIANKDVPCMDSLIAVVSYGKGFCSGNNIPDVFTNIRPYLSWIESIVWK